jgi:hypothetical protein
MSDIRVTARLSDSINATAQIANVVEIPVAPDVYAGVYEINVTDSDVAIPIKDKMASDNITVHQGIPIYTGATSYVIEDSGLTIATNGKRLNSDITVDISALETLATQISEVVG